MGRKTGRTKKGSILSPGQHMPSELAWEVWRLRQRGHTMGQIASRLGVGDPKNPTQVKRWVADTNRYLRTPAGQALSLSPGFISGKKPTLAFDLDRALRASKLEAARAPFRK